MKTATTQSGEKVKVTKKTRDLGHGKQAEVIYSDKSRGWEHIEDLNYHGGARKGAGRKPKEPTTVIRVPVSKLPAVQKLIKAE
jgi:hypothetical protein